MLAAGGIGNPVSRSLQHVWRTGTLDGSQWLMVEKHAGFNRPHTRQATSRDTVRCRSLHDGGRCCRTARLDYRDWAGGNGEAAQYAFTHAMVSGWPSSTHKPVQAVDVAFGPVNAGCWAEFTGWKRGHCGYRALGAGYLRAVIGRTNATASF